jgi:hypothetical protein
MFFLKEILPTSSPLFFPYITTLFCLFFGGLECVGHSFAYVPHFESLRDVWIRTQRAAIAIELPITTLPSSSYILRTAFLKKNLRFLDFFLFFFTNI